MKDVFFSRAREMIRAISRKRVGCCPGWMTCRKPRLVLAAIVMSVIVITGSMALKNEMASDYLKQANTLNHEIGITQSVLESTGGLDIGVHYPETGKKDADKAIKAKAYRIIDEFKEKADGRKSGKYGRNAELNVDYESYVYDGRYASVIMFSTMYVPGSSEAEKHVETYAFEISTQKEITIGDLFDEKDMELLSQDVRKSFEESGEYADFIVPKRLVAGTAPRSANFSKFAIKGDRLTFYFDSGKVLPGFMGCPNADVMTETIEPYVNLSSIRAIDRPKQASGSGAGMINPPDHDSAGGKPSSVTSSRKMDPKKPYVALTFDDGPHPRYTNRILTTLKKYDARATFFVVGNRVFSYSDIVDRISREGSEIGIHTWSHRNLTSMSDKEIKSQVQRSKQAIYEVTGVNVDMMRPTYGALNKKVRRSAGGPIVLWSVDPKDWNSKSAKRISNAVLSKVRSGDIVLMHDIYGASADAVEIILRKLSRKGYQFVTVSEMYALNNGKMKEGFVYYSQSN